MPPIPSPTPCIRISLIQCIGISGSNRGLSNRLHGELCSAGLLRLDASEVVHAPFGHRPWVDRLLQREGQSGDHQWEETVEVLELGEFGYLSFTDPIPRIGTYMFPLERTSQPHRRVTRGWRRSGLTLQASTSNYPVCQSPRSVSVGCIINGMIRRTLAKKMNIVRRKCKVKIIAK